MQIRQMRESDIAAIVPMYLDHYNNHENGCWSAEKAQKRIQQVITMQHSYSLIIENDGKAIGFAMGYFKQYDDLVSYTLEEILIAPAHQNQGCGSILLRALEQSAKEKGASLLELLSVNDDMHEHFYGKANYYKAASLIPRGKWLQ